MLAQHLHEFLVKEVALRHGEDPVLVEHLGIELLQFVEQHLVFTLYVIGISGNHEKQKRVSLYMSQEPQSESLTLTCSLDDARYVSHNKRLVVVVGNDAETWLKGGKRIIGNLRTRTGECRQQCGLTSVGETNKTNIGKELQLHDDGTLLHRLARLCEARCLIGGRTELEVAQSTPTTFQQYHLLSVVSDITDVFSSLGIIYHGTARYVYILVLAICAMTFVTPAIAAMLCKDVPLIL